MEMSKTLNDIFSQFAKDWKNAWEIYEKRVKQAEENQRLADQQLIEDYKKKFPEMHLKCPVCDADLVYDWVSQPTEKFCKTHVWADRTVEIVCKCPNERYHFYEQYELDEVTKGFSDRWEKDCRKSVKQWEYMNSPGYDNKCVVCGKLYYAYDNLDCIEVDGKQLCPECSKDMWVIKGNNKYVSEDYIRDERNKSSMYDGMNQYYSSVNEMLKHHNCLHGMKRDDLYIVHYPSRPNTDMWGLSGNVYREHWEFYGTSGTKWPHYCAYSFKFLPDMEGIKIREYKAKKYD